MAINTIYPIQINENKINHDAVFKFGYDPAIGTAEETVWDNGGIYSYPTSATPMKVSSSDNSDTSTIIVYGLDSDYNEITESLTITGQTEVTTTNNYIRVYRAKVTANVPSGDIYIGTGTVTLGIPANVYAKISIGENQTLMAVWTVPSGYTGYVYQFTVSSGTTSVNKYATGRLKVRNFGEVFQTKSIVTLNNTFIMFELGMPLVVEEKSDIEIRAIVSSGTDAISGTFTVVYVKNE